MGSTTDLGIFTTDAALIVRTWDGWLAECTGIPRADAIGRPVVELLPELAGSGAIQRLHEALASGAVHVLSPALHRPLFPCPPRVASEHFAQMQQRVTIGPLRDAEQIVGVMAAIEDVTARLDAERQLAQALASPDAEERRGAAEALASLDRLVAPSSFAPALANENWRVRRAAVEGLAGAADQTFIRALVTSLRDEHRNFALLSSALKLLAVTNVDVTGPLAELLLDRDADVRVQAALALGEQHDAAAIPPLLGALRDQDRNVRFQAIESLGRLRADAAVDDLVAIVESGDFYLAFAALDALTAIGDSTVADRLVPLLESETLRVPVADALGTLGDERAILPLTSALDHSPDAAASIVTALARIHARFDREFDDGPRVVDAVRQATSPAARQRAVEAVRRADAEQLPALVRVLSWFDGPDVEVTLTRLLGEESVRNEAIEALVRHGERVVDRVSGQLSSADADTRRAAVVALGRLGSRRATRSLVALLDDDNPELLVPVAGALARIGDREAFRPLLALIGHPDAGVRQSVIGALNSIGHPDLPSEVARLLDDPDPLLRESAVRVAGYFGYPETIDRLFEAVRDPEPAVRRAALELVAFVDDDRAATTLLQALESEEPQARAAAARALEHVDHSDADGGLVAALADTDAWVRYFAARSLAERGCRPAFAALGALAEADPAAQVRIAAIDALGCLRDERALPILQRVAGNSQEDMAAAALAALGQIAQAEGLSALHEAVRSESIVRRAAAVRGLAAHGSGEAAALLQWVAASEADSAIAASALEALATIAAGRASGAEAAVDALIAFFSDPARRPAAIAAVARLPASRIDDVARGLRHPHPQVRCATLEVLGRFQREDATALVAGGLTDASPAVREAAIVTLARVGARGIEPTLGQLAATDPSKAVRRAAATALARVRI